MSSLSKLRMSARSTGDCSCAVVLSPFFGLLLYHVRSTGILGLSFEGCCSGVCMSQTASRRKAH